MSPLFFWLLSVPAIIIATTAHEFTRALTSTLLGDKTPKNEKRLTLNPFKHFEPVGFIFLLAVNFGWGKPVNTSALYYKDRKKGILLTAIMPMLVNFVLAIVFAYLHKYTVDIKNVYLTLFFQQAFVYNVCLFIYNLVPVTPMDGAKILSVILPSNKYFAMMQYEKIIQMVFFLLLFLGVVGQIFSPLISVVDQLINLIVI